MLFSAYSRYFKPRFLCFFLVFIDDRRLPSFKTRCGGCVISLNNSWRITVDHRMHITCCATEDTDCFNNIS